MVGRIFPHPASSLGFSRASPTTNNAPNTRRHSNAPADSSHLDSEMRLKPPNAYVTHPPPLAFSSARTPRTHAAHGSHGSRRLSDRCTTSGAKHLATRLDKQPRHRRKHAAGTTAPGFGMRGMSVRRSALAPKHVPCPGYFGQGVGSPLSQPRMLSARATRVCLQSDEWPHRSTTPAVTPAGMHHASGGLHLDPLLPGPWRSADP